MESVLGRYRNLIILVGILFLQVLGLAVQVKRGGNDAENTRLIRIWVVGAITPFERGLVWVESSSNNLWHNYFYLRGVRAENRELKQQIEQMRLEQVRLNEDAAQAHRLQNLLAFKEQYIAKTVAAQVIGSSGSDLSRSVYIDKGEDDGLKRDMAVITADGIVGKVMVVYPSTAQVLLINDQTSGVGVILEKSRLQGVLRGSANGEVMLERIMSDEQVAAGETILTSGGDQIFPKGLPVGTVTRVSNGKDLFLNIKVKPAADISKLEEVLVLVEKQDRSPEADDTTHHRAADILAERLPSVPQKPPVATNTVGVTVTAKQGSVPAPPVTTASKPANAAGTPHITQNSTAAAGDHNSPANSGTDTRKLTVTPKPSAPPESPVNSAGAAAKLSAPAATQPPDSIRPKAAPATAPAPTAQPQTGDNPQ
jgi:rod shape-determining protein MreC